MMMHKGFIVLAAAAGIWAVNKTTHLGSYAGTLWSQAKSQIKRQVSTKFEIDRARHEIAQLDKDIAGAIRPIAEFKAAVQQLEKDVRVGQANLADRRDVLLRVTRDVESGAVNVLVSGKMLPLEKARVALERDFESFQRLERHVEMQRKLLDAKQQSLEASHEQLSKLVSKKREYEVRLAQLEAEEETLQIASLGNKMAVDDNRASAIESALAEIEQRQNVRRAELDLAAGEMSRETIANPRRTPMDAAGMRAYLEKASHE
jgi:hypothetical protein